MPLLDGVEELVGVSQSDMWISATLEADYIYKHVSYELSSLHPHRYSVSCVSHAPPLFNHVHRERLRVQIKEIECTNTSLCLPIEYRNWKTSVVTIG